MLQLKLPSHLKRVAALPCKIISTFLLAVVNASLRSKEMVYSGQRLTRIVETKNVVLEVRASGRDHHLTSQMLADLVADLTRLQSKLTCWNHDQSYITTEDRPSLCQPSSIS